MVTFDATASYDDLGILAYHWDIYGDGYSSSDEPVTSVGFATPGTYTVILTVWDVVGKSDTDQITVTVEPIWTVTVTSNLKSANVVTYVYTPETDGVWYAMVHNDGLRWLLIEVYELGVTDMLVGKDMLSFKNLGVYPTGTVSSNMFVMQGGVSYLIKLTPSGDIGTSAIVEDVFISLESYAAATEEVVSARTWSDG